MTEVFLKELQGYLRSMIGWVYMAFMLLISGIYTTMYNLFQQTVNFEFALGSMGFVFLILVPLMSMNVLAGERRNKTDQFLLTSPLSVGQIVLGKYLAMLALLAIPMIVICIYPLILAQFGAVNLGICYGTALAVFALGMALLAIGMFLSSLTDNPVVSAVITLALMLVLYWLQDIVNFMPTSAAFSLGAFTVLVLAAVLLIRHMTENSVVALIVGIAAEAAIIILYLVDASMFEGAFNEMILSFALFGKINNFVYGLFDLSALIYDLSVTGLFLFLTAQQIEARRWK